MVRWILRSDPRQATLVYRCYVFLPALATAAAAQDRMTRAEIRNLIVGKTVFWQGGAQSTYGAAGDYRFVNSRRNDAGTYTISDGVVCYKFKNDFLRCDSWRKAGSGVCITPMKSAGYRMPTTGGGCSSSIN
jgi:hypothetical protein